MYEDLDEIILNKPFEEATFLDGCKGNPKQRSLKEMKEASLELLKERLESNNAFLESFAGKWPDAEIIEKNSKPIFIL